jgi:hypothetical protein
VFAGAIICNEHYLCCRDYGFVQEEFQGFANNPKEKSPVKTLL